MNLDEQISVTLLKNPAVPIIDDSLDAEVLSFYSIYSVVFKERAELEGAYKDHQVQLSLAQDIPKSQVMYLFLSTFLSVFSTLHHPSLCCT